MLEAVSPSSLLPSDSECSPIHGETCISGRGTRISHDRCKVRDETSEGGRGLRYESETRPLSN